MNKYLISVIVPVYNCEKHLESSIGSLLSQTFFEQIEFVFVNDGSTDNSEAIIKSYVDRYSNIKIISQKNKGVSSARNTGIVNSKGDFLSFFDADDVAEPTLYEKLFKMIKKNDADISVVDYSMNFADETVKKHRPNCVKKISDKTEMLKSFFAGNLICTNPVDKMFARKVIDNVFFPEGYAIGEDMYFVYKALCAADTIVIDSTQVLYKYCLHSESAMKSTFSDKHLDSVYLAKKILEEFETTDELYNYAEANYIHEICKMFGLLYQTKVDKKLIHKTAGLREIFKKYRISKAIKYMDKKHVVALELMKISPHIYEAAYKIMKVG